MVLVNKLGDLIESAHRAGLKRCSFRLLRILNQRLLSPHWLGPRLQTRRISTKPSPLPPEVNAALEMLLDLRKQSGHGDYWDSQTQQVHLINQAGFPLLERPLGQQPPCRDGLWPVRLHGFDWLWPMLGNPAKNDEVQRILHSWLSADRIGRGPAWDAYTTSRRLIAFCAAYHLQGTEGLYEHIARSALFLQSRLERDLDNNHLFVNLKALAFCDLLFPELRSQGLQQQTRQELFEVLTRHVHEDGGHFEASCTYHLITLHDSLEIALLCQARKLELPAAFLNRLQRMEDFALTMLNPQGHLPLLNDSVLDEPMRFSTVQKLARQLPMVAPQPVSGSRVFKDTGYAVLCRGKEKPTWVVFDCGKLGPDHCPGHGHADMLSLEVWRGDQPVLCDSGTYQYASSAKRDYYRATASHNTATVDDQDQVRFVGPFRIADLTGARFTSMSLGAEQDWVEGEHEGYARLACQVKHNRSLTLNAAGILTIEDRFSGKGNYQVALAFHFAPSCKLDLETQGASIVLGDQTQMHLEVSGKGQASLESGWYSPSWFREEPIQVLRYRANAQGELCLISRLS